MAENPHFKELLQRLNEFQVEYLVVGGYAFMKYTEPRYTKDLDIWVRSSPQNARCVYQALNRFGAPLDHDQITVETFAEPRVVYQIGIAPMRIDIISEITGVRFSEAWKGRVAGTLFGIQVYFVSLEDLMANKKAVRRDTDLEQLKRIAEIRNKKDK